MRGEGVIFKRTMTDDKAKRMGLQPTIFSNKVYKKMNDLKVVVSNTPTKDPIMENALFGGMAPPKNGKDYYMRSML